MNQDALRSYLKRVAKQDEDLGQLSELALHSMRTATELFVDEIGTLIADHLAHHAGAPLTSDTLKSLIQASKSKTFEPVLPVLETLTIPVHREKPAKRRVKLASPRAKVVRRAKGPAPAPVPVMPPPATTSVVHIEEDDDYDASD